MAGKLPRTIVNEYYRDMLKQIRMMEILMQKAFAERITPIIIKFEQERNRERNRELMRLATNARIFGSLSDRLQIIYDESLVQIHNELASVSLELQSFFDQATSTKIAKKFVDNVNITDKQKTMSQISSVIGKKNTTKLKSIDMLGDVGVQTMVQSKIGQNVSLIKSVPQKYLAQVEEVIYKGLESGASIKTLGKDIADVGKVTERRGQFIARDQLGSVYGDITKKRQSNLGLKKFKWVTSKDEKVRDSHEDLEGKIFDWETGAQGSFVAPEVKGLLPGEDFRCRCTSAVVEEDVWALLDEIENQ